MSLRKTHCKKVSCFPSPQLQCHLPNFLWAGIRESLVSDIPAGNGECTSLFYSADTPGTINTTYNGLFHFPCKLINSCASQQIYGCWNAHCAQLFIHIYKRKPFFLYRFSPDPSKYFPKILGKYLLIFFRRFILECLRFLSIEIYYKLFLPFRLQQDRCIL